MRDHPPILRPLMAVLLCATPAAAADWPCFRGSGHDGISNERQIPTRWSAGTNVRWKAELPRPGNSGPIVSGGRVFVTCALDEKGRDRALICLDEETGRRLWIRSVGYQKADPTHHTNGYCSSTPAADGKRVVAWHGSAGVVCYDYDGNELWSRTDLGETNHGLGYGSSPIFYGGSVVLNFGPGLSTAVWSLDAATGATRWRTPEALEESDWVGSWATPVVATAGGRDLILVPMPQRLNAYDAADGKVVWSAPGLSKLVYTDALFDPAASVAVAMSGYKGPAIGVNYGAAAGAGDAGPAAAAKEPRRLWLVTQNPQRIGTGVVVGGHAYVANENGLECVEVATGKEKWRHRPENDAGDRATFWSPAAAAGGNVYATAQDGTTYVFAANPSEFKAVSTNPLGERVNAAPALANGRVYVRGSKHVYCIGGEREGG